MVNIVIEVRLDHGEPPGTVGRLVDSYGVGQNQPSSPWVIVHIQTGGNLIRLVPGVQGTLTPKHVTKFTTDSFIVHEVREDANPGRSDTVSGW